MSRFRFDWTPEREARLERLVTREGLGAKAIAKRFGCSHSVIGRKMRELGLAPAHRSRGELKAEFLEALSINGDVRLAAVATGIGPDRGYEFFNEARAEIGWQAV